MFKTHEIAIGPIFRVVIGTLALIDILLVLPLAAREFWFAVHGEWIRLFTAVILLFIFLGGISILRSAIRGRISVRSHSRKRKKTGNIEND
jgi:hypothetical protein